MKCARFECKSQGYFCDPIDENMRFCITHRTDRMINVRTIYNQRARSVIMLKHSIPVHISRSHKVFLLKSERIIPVPKKNMIGSPLRSARIILVPGAPKKQLQPVLANPTTWIPPFNLDQEDPYQPHMDIYADIANGSFRPFSWREHAKSIPLIAYLHIPRIL